MTTYKEIVDSLSEVQKKVIRKMREGYVLEINAGGYFWLVKLSYEYLIWGWRPNRQKQTDIGETVRRQTLAVLEEKHFIKAIQIDGNDYWTLRSQWTETDLVI